jgi:glycosyltransferase involved in cell wall biosynthesis
MSKTVSIIIPAWNEAKFIGRTIDHLKAASKNIPLAEIIVVDNNSTDATSEIAKAHGAHVVFEAHNQIARARNRGGHDSIGDFMFFIDADTWPSHEILNEGYRLLSQGSVGVGSLVEFDVEAGRWQWLLSLWNWLSRNFNLAAGSFLLCRREGFFAVKGFPTSVYASEEVYFSNRLRRWGKKQNLSFDIIKNLPIVTSARKLHGSQSLALLLQTIVIVICPIIVRWRWSCWLWYRRPRSSQNDL